MPALARILLETGYLREEQLKLAQMPVGSMLTQERCRWFRLVLAGVVSTSLRTADGSSACVGLNVPGDLLHLNHLFDLPSDGASLNAVMPGQLLLIPYESVAAAFQINIAFQAAIFKLAAFRIREAQQLAFCNCHHDLETRLACYLLTLHDSCPGLAIRLTQERFSHEFGVQRTTVVNGVSGLRAMGALSTTRGAISIENRSTLEGIACECYATLRVPRIASSISPVMNEAVHSSLSAA